MAISRMAYGNEAGIVVVDIEQRVCLLNIGSPDLYGAQDPYSRAPRSPKKGQLGGTDVLGLNTDREERQPRSPSVDQVSLELLRDFSKSKCMRYSLLVHLISRLLRSLT